MNIVNINDKSFLETETYKNFIKDNPGSGRLMIRAFSAGGAIPISNLKIVISKVINNTKVIFFQGETDISGMIEKLTLPTPQENPNDLIAPKYISYDIEAIYEPNKTDKFYVVNMYNNTCVVQNINIVPEINRGNDYYGR